MVVAYVGHGLDGGGVETEATGEDVVEIGVGILA